MTRIAPDIPGGLNSDDTTFASAPAWADGSNFRFRLSRPQTIGGWESVINDTLGGVCRTAFCWTDNDNTLTLAFGTHQSLELYQGGSLYDITPSSGFTAGEIDGTGSTGYGTGAYGMGGYGSPSTTDYFPLTWSLAAFGETLMACPRGQTIFQWSNNTASPAALIANAPDEVTYMLVARDFVFALGCNEEVSGDFNPLCVRHSALRDPTGWTTGLTSAATSREYILPGGGRIVGGLEASRSVLVWTSHSLFLATYVGQIGQIWKFERVGRNCGLIGPNAAVVVGSTAFWISADRQFHSYTLGGSVQTVSCPIREDFADNLSASQGDKIVASTIAEFGEVRWDYPDARDGYENSRYIALCVEGDDAGSWYRGEMARTAMVDAGPSQYPVGVTYGGAIYWHERGNSADGGAFTGFIETADVYLDENVSVLVRQFWPDLKNQTGAVSLTLYSRPEPEAEETTFGPLSLAVGDAVVDIPGKAAGRIFRIRYEVNSAPARVRIGRGTYDVRARGRR